MTEFRRLISYLYEYEGKVKGKNVGFVKLETRNGLCKLNVSVKKIYMGNGNLGIYLLSARKEIFLGNLFLRNGCGEFRTVVQSSDVEQSGESMENCYGLSIHEKNGGWKVYTTIWEDAVAQAAQVVLESVTSENAVEKELKNKQLISMVPENSEKESNDKNQEEKNLTEEHDNTEKNAEEEKPSEQESLQPKENIQDNRRQENPIQENPIQEEYIQESPMQESYVQENHIPENGVQESHIQENSIQKNSNQENKVKEEHIHIVEKEAQENPIQEEHFSEEIAGHEEKEAVSEKEKLPDFEMGRLELETQEPDRPLHMPLNQELEKRVQQNQNKQAQIPQMLSNRRTMPPCRSVQKTSSTQPGTMPRRFSERNTSFRPQADSGHSQPAQAGIRTPSRGQVIPSNARVSSQPLPGIRTSGQPLPLQNEFYASGQAQQPQSGIHASGQVQPQSGIHASSQVQQPQSGIHASSQVQQPQASTHASGQVQSTQSGFHTSGQAQSAQAGFQTPGQVQEPQPVIRQAEEEPLIVGDPEALAKLEKEENTAPIPIWDFLSKTYPKIQAFDSQYGCQVLVIKPQDIGLLPREIWIYGNNSFLLHGYYNYRYLILARLENPNGSPRYLLGVPGHYYSNEKYMASMFGFPNFVLSKKQQAQDGRFGYWYTDVRLNDGNVPSAVLRRSAVNPGY